MSLAFSPDGAFVAKARDRLVTVLYRGNRIHCFHSNAQNLSELARSKYIDAVAWSPDGRYIATGGLKPGQYLCIWDAVRGRCLFSLLGDDKRDGPVVKSIAWSPDGKLIAAHNSRHVLVFHLQCQILLHSVSKRASPLALAWSSNTSIKVLFSNKRVYKWNLLYKTTTSIPLLIRVDRLQFASFSPDTKQVAVCTPNALRILDTEDGSYVRGMYHHDRSFRVSWSPDGVNVATSARGSYTATIFNVREKHGGYHMHTPRQKPIFSLAWSPFGDLYHDINSFWPIPSTLQHRKAFEQALACLPDRDVVELIRSFFK